MKITHKNGYDIVEVAAGFDTDPIVADRKCDRKLAWECNRAPELRGYDMQFNSFSFVKEGRKMYASIAYYTVATSSTVVANHPSVKEVA